MTAVRSQLEVDGCSVTERQIEDTWQYVYLRHFLKKTTANATFCRKQYYLYHQQEHISLDSVSVFLFVQLPAIFQWYSFRYSLNLAPFHTEEGCGIGSVPSLLVTPSINFPYYIPRPTLLLLLSNLISISCHH